MNLDKPAVDPSLFPLDPNVTFLNHGSFGSCPLAVLEHQQEIRNRIERQPVHFYQRELEPLLDEARASLAAFVGCPSEDLVYVTNATEGINTVLHSLEFNPGDELLVSNHEYNACRNAIHFAAERNGANVKTIQIPFPIESEQEVVDAVMREVTSNTRLLLIDHVTSQTGMILPIRRIIDQLADRSIDTLVDGAHAPGMLPLNIDSLGATYYTGNCHKWICAPKAAAFLYTRSDKRDSIRPLTISHGANSPRTDRTRFLLEFGWKGTRDQSAALTLPYCIEYMDSLISGGWSAIMEYNRKLALAGRAAIQQELWIEPPCPDEMIGSLASIPLPDSKLEEPYHSLRYLDYWQKPLIEKHHIEVPVITWPSHPKRVVRISAQVYNSLSQYKKLGKVLKKLKESESEE